MNDTRYLEERLIVLEDIQTRARGEQTPTVCSVCYYVQLVKTDNTCLCDQTTWMPIGVVLSKVRALIEEHRNEERTRTAPNITEAA